MTDKTRVYNHFNRELYNGLRKTSIGWPTGNVVRHIHPELFNLYSFHQAKEAVNVLIRISLLSIEPNTVDLGSLDDSFIDISRHAQKNLSFGITGMVAAFVSLAKEFFNHELYKAEQVLKRLEVEVYSERDCEVGVKPGYYWKYRLEAFGPFEEEADCIIDAFNKFSEKYENGQIELPT